MKNQKIRYLLSKIITLTLEIRDKENEAENLDADDDSTISQIYEQDRDLKNQMENLNINRKSDLKSAKSDDDRVLIEQDFNQDSELLASSTQIIMRIEDEIENLNTTITDLWAEIDILIDSK